MRKGEREMGSRGDGEMRRWGVSFPYSLSSFPPFPLSTLLLITILALAALLRFYALDASSLWSDEGNTWALIQRSFAQIARDAAADIHPPGYYWLLKLWSMPFGTSAFAMRSLSALCGVLLVWVVYQIGLQLANSPSASVRFTQDKLRTSHSALLATQPTPGSFRLADNAGKPGRAVYARGRGRLGWL